MSYLLAFLILLQGCTVYKKQNISLEQAVATKGKVKLVTKTNDRHKFKYITNVNGEYYGIDKRKGEVIKYPLHEKDINTIRPKSKGQSIAITILAFSPLIYVAGGLILFGI